MRNLNANNSYLLIGQFVLVFQLGHATNYNILPVLNQVYLLKYSPSRHIMFNRLHWFEFSRKMTKRTQKFVQKFCTIRNCHSLINIIMEIA